MWYWKSVYNVCYLLMGDKWLDEEVLENAFGLSDLKMEIVTMVLKQNLGHT